MHQRTRGRTFIRQDSCECSSIEKASLEEKYGLVMTFESVHDMAYPIDALRKMKNMVSENGAVLVGDVKMKDKLEDTHYSIKRKGQYYVFSDQSLPDLIVVSVHKSGLRAITISVLDDLDLDKIFI